MILFDKNFAKLLGGFSLLIVLSFFAYLYPSINTLLFFILILITLILSFYKLSYGVYIAIAELLIGSQGYLFYYDIGSFKLSIRLGIFLIVFLALIYDIIKQKRIIFFEHQHAKYYLLFALTLILGFIHGYLRQTPLKDIFLDVNGYFYFAYIIVFVQSFLPHQSKKNSQNLNENKQKYIKDISQIIVAGLITLSIHSLFLLYVFSHLIIPWMRPLYKWTRDHRIGEIARPFIESNFHRIFFQHQIFAVLAFIIAILFIFMYSKYERIRKKYSIYILTGLLFSISLLSLSRSFWVGLAVIACAMLIFLIIQYRFDWKSYLTITKSFIAVLLISISILLLVMNFPFPRQTFINSADILKNRLNFTTEAAVASRWNLLPIITEANIKSPIIGYGFGKSLRYQAEDPRVRNEQNPEGWFSTYAFEWGYQDIILKLGIIGLFVYLLLIYKIFKQGHTLYKHTQNLKQKYITAGILLAGITLCIIHFFTPYLNHPLGIGYLLITQTYFDFYS